MLDKIRTWLAGLIARLRVIVKAAPTYLAGAALVVGVFADEVIPLLPDTWAVQAAVVVAGILALITAAGAVIARLTPVLIPESRGLLARPPIQSPPAPPPP